MRTLPLLALLALTQFGTAQLNPNSAKPPVAKKVPAETKLHGLTLIDNYAWLREKTNPETINYIKAENAYREKVMAPTLALQKKLYNEIVARIQEDDSAVPIFDNGYWYYSRQVKGKDYSLQCRRKGTMKAKEEIILDENQLAKGEKYFSLGAFNVSPNGNLLAYTVDTTGFREYYLFIKDLKTGKLLKDRFGKVDNVEWATDNKTLFYVAEDEAKRPFQVWRRSLGSTQPTKIFEEPDALFYVGIGTSTDKKFLFTYAGTKDTSETQFLDLSKPTSELKVIKPRGGNSQYSVDHHEGEFIITTNDQGPNFRIVSAPVSDPSPKNWRQIVPHKTDSVISEVATYKDFMVVSGRTGGFPTLQIRPYGLPKVTTIPTPDVVGDILTYRNPEYNTSSITYSYQSMTRPSSVFRYDIKSRKSTLLKQTKVNGYKESNYISELKWATANDGTKIPITIVRKKTTIPSAKTPLFLYAYGSYGAPTDPWFSVSRLNYLDRGMIFAIAHIRGGGEFGRKWYESGKMFNKLNTFTDFIDAGDFLVDQKITSHEKMVINGGSAGGLLIGAVVNMRPNLAKVAVADVPFVDVINTMLDETIPLTVGEFIEWGNPKIKDQFDYMMQYSPYDNIKPQAYPNMLITTSLNDSQVLYHEPTKWIAKLRDIKTDNNVLLLRCNMDAGHGGASGRYSAYEEIVKTQAFVLFELGIKK